MKKFLRNNKNCFLLLLIVIIASILRFYHLFAIPFTHDELSAIFRTQFDNFHDLIAKGVIVDGHPAGIQLFLYYWIKLVGTTEWLIKLPFLLSGIFSVILVYFIAKKWYNNSVGLFVATFLASLQYFIFNSQIARPYASGLFFTLLFVYFWTQLVLSPEKKFFFSLVGFIISGTLAAYNHYFSLLFIIIVGISGLFLIKKRYFWQYFLGGIAIFCLFLPHFRITLSQLQLKGIGDWLAKPSLYFLVNFFSYLSHHSWVVLIMVIVLLFFGILSKKRGIFFDRRTLLFSTFFFLPIIIGYIYSYSVDAVLQYSVLIFSTPWLFFLLFSWIKEQKFIVNLLIISIIFTINIITLIFHQHYYKYAYQSIYEKIIDDFPSKNQDSTLFLVYNSDKIQNFYMQKYKNRHSYINLKNCTLTPQIYSLIKEKSAKYPYLYLGTTSAIPPNFKPIIQNIYPTILQENCYFFGETTLYSQKNSKQNELQLIAQLNPKNSLINWQNIDERDTFSNNNVLFLRISPQKEWSCNYSFSLNKIKIEKNDFIDIYVDFIANSSLEQVELVSELKNNENNIFWSSCKLSNCIENYHDTTSIHRLIHSIKLADIKQIKKNTNVNIYLWNRGQEELGIATISIFSRKGNPFLYGLYDKIDVSQK